MQYNNHKFWTEGHVKIKQKISATVNINKEREEEFESFPIKCSVSLNLLKILNEMFRDDKMFFNMYASPVNLFARYSLIL